MEADLVLAIWGATAVVGLGSGALLFVFVIVPALYSSSGKSAALIVPPRPLALTPDGRVRCRLDGSSVPVGRCRGCAWFEDEDEQTPSIYVVCRARRTS